MMTSHLQPMDVGIINAFKAQYRGYLVRYIVDAIDGGRSACVEVSDAMCWIKLSWDEVMPDTITIIYCWHHTGILPSEKTGEGIGASAAAPDMSTASAIQRDFGNLFAKLSVAFSIPVDMLMTPAEYMAVDSQVPTSNSLSDGQIIEMVTSSSQLSQAGSDEDEEGEEECEAGMHIIQHSS